MSSKGLSLYVHFPFCVKKCAYCAFFSVPSNDETLFDSYAESCVRDIKAIPKSVISTVYFGGGTPTVLGEKRLAKVLDAVFACHTVTENAEITTEANPGTVNADGLRTLRESGFNRLSLGLQSANDETLRRLGRIHDFRKFCDCYDDAAKFFDNISVDVMFALPNDDPKPTFDFVKELSPKHISAYSLILEENTPLFKKQKDYVFPSEDEEEEQYAYLCAALSDYEHYEISSFAKKGYESRHNSAYWKRSDYIGIGPAAHSFWKNRRFSCPNDIRSFINGPSFPFDTDFETSPEISQEEAEEERVLLGLRLAEGVTIPQSAYGTAQKFVDAGYATLDNGVFAMNEKGFRISNYIISNILAVK